MPSTEITADFQAVTLQGTLTYRVADPAALATLLDFSIRANGRYLSDDPDKVPDRLVETRRFWLVPPFRNAGSGRLLVGSEDILGEVLAAARTAEPLAMLGVELLACQSWPSPTPEIARALEAEAREALQRRVRRGDLRPPERRGRAGAPHQGERAQHRARGRGEEARRSASARWRRTSPSRSSALPSSNAGARTRGRTRTPRLRAATRRSSRCETVDWRTLMAVSAGGADPKLHDRARVPRAGRRMPPRSASSTSRRTCSGR